jgi:hypothetical protein
MDNEVYNQTCEFTKVAETILSNDVISTDDIVQLDAELNRILALTKEAEIKYFKRLI